MRKIYLLLIIMLVATTTMMAQNVVVPEFKNEPMPVKNDSTLGRLEFTHFDPDKTDPAVTQILFMSVSQQDYYTYDYPKSPVRLQTSTRFMIKLSDPEMDPESVFLLTKVAASKKNRVVYASGKQPFGPSMKVKIEFVKIAPGIYQIIPEQLLPNTEYAFVYIPDTGSHVRCYLFGVD